MNKYKDKIEKFGKEKDRDPVYFNNYRQMCKVLDLPTKTGKSKQLQMADLSRYFNLYKDGQTQKVWIGDIFDEPTPKIENRNGSPYAEPFQLTLIGILEHSDQYEDVNGIKTKKIYATAAQLAEQLNFVNKNYKYYKNCPHALAETLMLDTHLFLRMIEKIDYWDEMKSFATFVEWIPWIIEQDLFFTENDVQKAYQQFNISIKNIIKNNLKKLERNKIITTSDAFRCSKDGVEFWVENKAQTEEMYKKLVGFSAEAIKILNQDLEKETKAEQKRFKPVKNEFEIFMRGKYQQYIDIKNNLAYNTYKIDWYVRGYKIMFNPEYNHQYKVDQSRAFQEAVNINNIFLISEKAKYEKKVNKWIDENQELIQLVDVGLVSKDELDLNSIYVYSQKDILKFRILMAILIKYERVRCEKNGKGILELNIGKNYNMDTNSGNFIEGYFNKDLFLLLDEENIYLYSLENKESSDTEEDIIRQKKKIKKLEMLSKLYFEKDKIKKKLLSSDDYQKKKRIYYNKYVKYYGTV